MRTTTVITTVVNLPPSVEIGVCGHSVNRNGNCFQDRCWNHHRQRHDGQK